MRYYSITQLWRLIPKNKKWWPLTSKVQTSYKNYKIKNRTNFRCTNRFCNPEDHQRNGNSKRRLHFLARRFPDSKLYHCFHTLNKIRMKNENGKKTEYFLGEQICKRSTRFQIILRTKFNSRKLLCWSPHIFIESVSEWTPTGWFKIFALWLVDFVFVFVLGPVFRCDVSIIICAHLPLCAFEYVAYLQKVISYQQKW